MIQLSAMNCHVQRVALGFRKEAKHGKERRLYTDFFYSP